MKKPIIKPVLPLLLVIAFALSIGSGVGTALGKYIFSQDVAEISLSVKPAPPVKKQLINPDAASEDNKEPAIGEDYKGNFNPETGKIQTVTLVKTLKGMQVVLGATTTESVQMLLNVKDGFVLPEAITIEVDGTGTAHTVYITAANSHLNPAGVIYNAADNSIILQASFINRSDSTIYVTGFATVDFSD